MYVAFPPVTKARVRHPGPVARSAPKHLSDHQDGPRGAAEGWIAERPTIWDGLNPVRIVRLLWRSAVGRVHLATNVMFAVLFALLPQRGHVVDGSLVLVALGGFSLGLSALLGSNRERVSDLPMWDEGYKSRSLTLFGWIALGAGSLHLLANLLSA
jgi:hypothetical protein